MSSHEGPITARSLMRTTFRTIAADRPLHEAKDYLLDFPDKQSPLPLIVVHGNGSLAGLLTPVALFRALLRKVRLEEIHTIAEPELLAAMDGQLGMPVSEAMMREVPRAYPDDRLVALMKLNSERREHRVEFTPVLENETVIGIIYITDIFHAAASLALTHETEGIILPSDKGDDEIGH